MRTNDGGRSGQTFPSAKEDRAAAKRVPDTPQTRSPAYRLAYDDQEFILRDDLRAVRLQLEFLKPELILSERGIESTIVIFGSARIPDPEQESGDTPDGAVPENPVSSKAGYYGQARKFARFASLEALKHYGREFVVVSGGGPGIMEAANRGAADVNAPSIGLNIVLPHEQEPNRYITPELCFQFHYFALRKMHFLLRAKALACFPGGFGTLDELFEALCLMQTGKIDRIPVLLFGREFWDRVINFNALVEEGTISPRDLELFSFVETAEEGWAAVKAFYAMGGGEPRD